MSLTCFESISGVELNWHLRIERCAISFWVIRLLASRSSAKHICLIYQECGFSSNTKAWTNFVFIVTQQIDSPKENVYICFQVRIVGKCFVKKRSKKQFCLHFSSILEIFIGKNTFIQLFVSDKSQLLQTKTYSSLRFLQDSAKVLFLVVALKYFSITTKYSTRFEFH